MQPLVACLGNPVAGNPTQFVMSRIAREAGLDWRFFTSEVETEQFEPALRGVQALGMAGMAILDPFQERTVGLLDSVSLGASLLGRVSVARREGNAWIGDHTCGAALVRLLRSRLTDQPLREDGTMSPQSIAVLGSPPLVQLIDGLLPSLDGDFRVYGFGKQAENTSTDVSNIDPMASLERPVRVMVIDSPASERFSSPKVMTKWLQQIAWSTSPIAICTRGIRQLEGEVLEWLQGRDLMIIDEIEWMTFRAAADFHFWTGVEPSVEIIREALEEYLQW